MTRRVVGIFAHPDDAEIVCFGTLITFVRRGYAVSVYVVRDSTSGVSVAMRAEGGPVRVDREVRFSESVEAFAGSGISIEWLNRVREDGDTRLVTAIEDVLLKTSPSIVISHWPSIEGLDHADHSLVGNAVSNASLRSPSVRLLLQGEPQHSFRCGFKPNYFLDITEVFDAKMEALGKHRSQVGRAYLSRDYHVMKARLSAHAAQPQLWAEGRLFESFVCPLLVDKGDMPPEGVGL